MLFQNKLSGNIVSATHPDVIEQMRKSPAYEPWIAPEVTEEPVEETIEPETVKEASEEPAEAEDIEEAPEEEAPEEEAPKAKRKTGKAAKPAE